MTKTINIGCNGLIIKDNKLLLGLRKNCFGEGTYGLPGGHLEYGEKLVEAVKRELLEEVGIEATQVNLLSIIDNIKEQTHYLQVNFLVEQFEGDISCKEQDKCEDWEWFDLDQLPDNIFQPHTLVIRAFKDRKIYPG